MALFSLSVLDLWKLPVLGIFSSDLESWVLANLTHLFCRYFRFYSHWSAGSFCARGRSCVYFPGRVISCGFRWLHPAFPFASHQVLFSLVLLHHKRCLSGSLCKCSCVSYFPHCCEKVPDKKQRRKGGRAGRWAYLGHRSRGAVHHSREGRGSTGYEAESAGCWCLTHCLLFIQCRTPVCAMVQNGTTYSRDGSSHFISLIQKNHRCLRGVFLWWFSVPSNWQPWFITTTNYCSSITL